MKATAKLNTQAQTPVGTLNVKSEAKITLNPDRYLSACWLSLLTPDKRTCIASASADVMIERCRAFLLPGGVLIFYFLPREHVRIDARALDCISYALFARSLLSGIGRRRGHAPHETAEGNAGRESHQFLLY